MFRVEVGTTDSDSKIFKSTPLPTPRFRIPVVARPWILNLCESDGNFEKNVVFFGFWTYASLNSLYRYVSMF